VPLEQNKHEIYIASAFYSFCLWPRRTFKMYYNQINGLNVCK